ncbi:hypothetical protein JVX88_13775 [Leptolyngbya sp. 7M]|nr:hypothetical protein [Leptolyngbya sp. 7M]QYO67754.1 hypothetical protein JVX88_13775 [Leptolyngbya sp. 7M]
MDEPGTGRRTEDRGVELAVAVVVAGCGDVAVGPEGEAEEAEVLAPEHEPVAVRGPPEGYVRLAVAGIIAHTNSLK